MDLPNALQHVDWRELFLPALGPVFVLFYLLEWWAMRRRRQAQAFTPQRLWTNLGLGASYLVFEVFAKLLVSVPAALWVYQYRLFDIPVTGWTALPIFIGVEFCYYWFHRCSHRVRWFWSAHVVHHSDEGMNLSTAMRQSLLYSITGWWLFFMPMVVLGVHPAWVYFFYALDLAYQYFIHTETVGKLPGWVEYLFDTPSNHRAHHGRNDEYIDRNYGGVLIVFDRWFGTYVQEQAAVDYGIRTPGPSQSLWALNFHEFACMWRAVLRPGPLGQRLKHLWGPPEYKR